MRRSLIAAVIATAIAAVPALAQQTTLQDRSGTITLGGTAQVLMPVSPNRRGCLVQNNSVGDLWVNDVGTAAIGGSSIKVPAGAQYACVGVTGAALSVFGATTAQAFAAREW
jgi:hypothetical protein